MSNQVTGAVVNNRVRFSIDNSSYAKTLAKVRKMQTSINKFTSLQSNRNKAENPLGLPNSMRQQGHIASFEKYQAKLQKVKLAAHRMNEAFNKKAAASYQRFDRQKLAETVKSGKQEGLAHRMNAVFDQKAAQRRAKMSGDEELRTDRGSNRLMAGFSATKDLRLQKGQRSALRAEMYRLNQEYRKGNITLQSYNQKLTKQIALAKRQSAMLAARKTPSKLNRTTEAMSTNLLGGTAGRMVGGMSRAVMVGGGAVGAIAGGVGTVVAAYGLVASASIAAARGIVSFSAEITKSKMAMAATFTKSELPDAESYVYTEAMRLGTTLAEVSTSYADLYYSGKSAGMSNKEIKDLNSGMLNYGAVMSKTGYELSFVTKGLTQMLSKGSTISKEELNV